MPTLYRIQPTEYDRRTDQISPRGRSYGDREDIDAMTEYGYVVLGPLTGWGQYTHLIATPNDPIDGDGYGAPYFLARFVAGS